MAQLAIAINVSGRVVCERRRCGTKKKSPRRIQADGGGQWGVCGDARQAASTALSAAAGQEGRVPCGICGFAGSGAGWRSVRLLRSLTTS